MDPIKVFITRPVFTTMLIMAVVVFGIFAYPKIGVDQFPDIDFPVVTVTTILPGADPESVERDVSDPLEEAINTISGLETLKSVNVESVSQIIVMFDLDKPVDVAAQEVRDKVQATLHLLPDNIDQPIVDKFDIGAAPVITLALSGPMPIEELTRIADDVLKPALERQQGVGAIEIVGGREREIQIEVDPDRLRSYGLAASDVVMAVQAQHLDVPSGRTVEPGRERTIKLSSEMKSVEELRELIIPAPTPSPVRLRDVAHVIDGPQEARSAATFEGQTAVALVIRKQSGANTVEVAARVQESLGELSTLIPDELQVRVVNDESRFIRSSISSVQFDLVLGGVLAVLIVLFFLRNGPSTLIAALALPVSVIGTVAAMKALNFTFNNITMLALTLSIGILIDDAIVVIENVVRHMEEGASPFRAAWEGTKEIALAVFAVTLSIVAVFVPVAFMEGVVGKFFYQFGITVSVAVMISFLVSLTLTPMMSSKMLKQHTEGGTLSQAIERLLRGVERFYQRTLGWMLDHRKSVIALAVFVLLLTLGLATQLKATFIPDQDAGVFVVDVELPVGSDLASTEQRVREIAAQFEGMPGVAHLYTSAGGGAQEQVHKGQVVVSLIPIKERNYNQQEIMRWARENLVRSADTMVSVQNLSSIGGGPTQTIQFNLRSNNWPDLQAASEKMLEIMQSTPGFVDVDTSFRAGKPQLDVRIDRERAASMGIPAATVGTTLRALMGGDKVGDYRDVGQTYEIKLRLPDAVRGDEQRLGALTVRNGAGELVEIRNIAHIESGEGPSQIDRQARQRQITMLANLDGLSLSEAMGFLTEKASAELPTTVYAEFDGNAKELAKTGMSFLMALLLGIILLYMILAAQFESLVDPLTIMVSLPFAVIGAIGGLLVTGLEMSMFAMIGMIMLMGLVSKNGILLVDFTNQLKRRGRSTYEALMEAGPLRLRPILMTTIAMIGGMMPPALARGDGAETRVPMAVAIIGGLITSTVLTLGVVPVVYLIFDGWKAKVARLFGKETAAVDPSVEAEGNTGSLGPAEAGIGS